MFKDKLKSLFKYNKNSENENKMIDINDKNKRKIENIVVFIVILIITIIAINMIWNNNESMQDKKEISEQKLLASDKDENEEILETSKESLEYKLENILKQIKGVGKVKVLVTYSQTSETLAMYNEDKSESNTEETDTSGGNRKITENNTKKEIIYKEVDGEKIPVTQSIIKPKAEGAIITATGASDANIKANIIQAVEAVTGLATHKIQVFEMNE